MDQDLKVVELFGGSCSFSNVAKKFGYKTWTTDWEPFEDIDHVTNIMDLDLGIIPFQPDIVWASPPCTAFSVATIGRNWHKDPIRPKTEKAEEAMMILEQTVWILNELQPKYFILENPRGMMRTMPAVEWLDRTTVTYCQYGEERMKPTDLWNNLEGVWTPRKHCKNGDPCHVAAPRGSNTGTQGMKNAYERSKVPFVLCFEILRDISIAEFGDDFNILEFAKNLDDPNLDVEYRSQPEDLNDEINDDVVELFHDLDPNWEDMDLDREEYGRR